MVELIGHIDVPSGADSNIKWKRQLSVRRSNEPRGDKHSIGRELLDAMVEDVNNVDHVAGVDGHASRTIEPPVLGPDDPQVATNAPSDVNFWMRSLRRSATYVALGVGGGPEWLKELTRTRALHTPSADENGRHRVGPARNRQGTALGLTEVDPDRQSPAIRGEHGARDSNVRVLIAQNLLGWTENGRRTVRSALRWAPHAAKCE